MSSSAVLTLADQIENLLPQTQCGKCGYPACRPYAEAIADGSAGYNQCPPGGAEGVARLAQLLDRPLLPLNPANGLERPRARAVIDEAACIGCTLCIQACPVDCITMVEVTPGLTGWQAWSQEQADAARARHDFRSFRLRREKQENDDRLAAKAAAKLKEVEAADAMTPAEKAEQERKKAIIQAAIERARIKKEQAAANDQPTAKPTRQP